MNIMITGIAGSLGKEFANYLSKDHMVFGYDNNEWATAELPDLDIRLEDFSEWKFDQDPCDLVIHCAAYKHIEMGETNPNAFIDNNIIKTRKLFAEAFKNNADILFISSDKAVEPCSLYGYTKAIGEKLTWFYNGHVARCGNFFGSSGSCIPIWEKAIKEERPIPITDTRMKRFVIQIDDAVKQIWKGYEDKEKLIIPRCREIMILDLVSEIYPDKDIKIIGIREGEKLREKLRWDSEV